MLQRLSGSLVLTPWIVVNSQPNRENAAIYNLTRQGYVTYCPMILKRIRHAGSARSLPRPLFPGYVFVNLDPEKGQWRSILSTVGVRSLVRFGERPAPLDPGFVQSLREREQGGVIVRPEIVRPAEPYVVGQKVRVNGGPFDGTIATILSLGEKDRLLVLFDILQRSVKAEVHADKVMPV
jgi:transcriptional antiterminator RfaH